MTDLEREMAPKARRKPSTTPTQRCMAELKRRGWTGAIAEKWVRFPPPGHHVDLFGVIDIVAIVPPGEEVECSKRDTAGNSSAEHGGDECCLQFDMEGEHRVRRIPGAIVGIQASPGTRHAAHRAKILAEPRARLWVEAGGKLELWSWSKRGDRGTRKLWILRVEAFTVESWIEQPIGGGQ